MSIKYKAMNLKYYAICGGVIGIVLYILAGFLAGGGHGTSMGLVIFFTPLVIFPLSVVILCGVPLYIFYAILIGWGIRRNNGARILIILIIIHFGALGAIIFFFPDYWDDEGLREVFRINALFTVCSFVPFILALFLACYVAVKTRTIEDGVPFCGKCHYNLTGNTSGICPECGEEIKHDLEK